MKARITKRSVDALTPKIGPDGSRRVDFLWDTEVAGFGCKVTGAGRKVYVLQYRTRDQSSRSAPKRISLGNHGAITPHQARAMASELLLQVKAGKHPEKKWRKRESPSVAALVERFLEEYLPGKKRPPRASTLREYQRIFRSYIVPKLGHKRVEEIRADDIERLHSGMRRSPYQANRVLAVLRPAFDQAERWGWRPQNTNPARYIDRYPEERRGARKEVMLTPAQMKALLEAIEAGEREGLDRGACAALRVAFWTGWRIGEVLALEWANLDFDLGRAKLLHTKTATEEYRSLPREAIAVLESLPRVEGCPYVFPGRKRGTHRTTVRQPWLQIRRQAGLDDLEGLGALRLHDLRHNVVSWDVSRGVPLEIAGRNVGHRSRDATEVYAHFAPDALKRAADDRARAMLTAVEEVPDS